LRLWASAAAALIGAASLALPQQAAEPDWRLVVLGIAQDAGMPHLGCDAWVCRAARRGQRARARVSCLGVVDKVSGRAFLFDATPDLPLQLTDLTGGRVPDGIFLTHAHIGHYTGLMYLGKESISAKDVPVYATRKMGAYLTHNGPWSLLVKDGHIALNTLTPDRPVDLGDGLRVTAFTVPHRDELSDTVGYRIEGPRRKLLFIPDIDKWEKWDRDIRSMVDGVDVAFLDGSFASSKELPNRSIEDIPHPLMSHTRKLLSGTAARLWFIHLNHTNREWHSDDVAREGMELPI